MNQTQPRPAIYGRVSWEPRAQEHTIASRSGGSFRRDALWQLMDWNFEDCCCFLDEGHSGAVLIRPGPRATPAIEPPRD